MKKVLFVIATLLIGGMMLTGCKKDPQPTPDPDPTTKTKTVVYKVDNTYSGLTMSKCFKLSVTYLDANGQSVTENNVTLPWTKSIEAKLPFTAKMEGTFSYNAADLPDQVVYGRRYGIGTYDGNALVISLVGNMGTQSKEAFLNTMAEHPDRLQFSQEENF